MKPAPFRYVAPDTVEEALSLLAEHGDLAAVLAGGQSLVPLLNLRLARPDVVIDINRIAGLDAVEVTDVVHVGALARAQRLATDGTLHDAHPLLPHAISHVGHPQIRHRTTVGGNLAHADPASELPAVLAVTDGWLTLASQAGRRQEGWHEFFAGPYMTSRVPDEMVLAAAFPVAQGMRFGFQEVSRRPGDYALAGVCAGLRVESGVVAEARIALFGVGSTVMRVTRTEDQLRGVAVTDDVLGDLAAAVASEVEPVGDIHASATYRRRLGARVAAQLIGELWTAGAP